MSNLDSPISKLPAASTLSGAEVAPVDQGGVTVKATVTQILAASTTSIAAETAARIAADALIVSNLAASSGSSLVGFLQSGIGAVPRTMLSKERDIVSVFDFLTTAQIADIQAGSLTLDTSTAFKAFAIALTASPGSFALIPPGNYKISETNLGAYNASFGSSIDFFGASNITILGYGATLTVTATGAGGKVWLRFRSCSNVTVKGLSFVGYQTADGSSVNSGVPLYVDTAASNFTFEDLNGNSGWGIIEFQTDDLINMAAKYKNVTLRNIKTNNYHHAMELLHIDGLTTDGIRMSAIGTGNNINLRGMYVLGVTNWNGDGIYSDNCGLPGTGGTPVFLREYAPTTGTLPNYNCDGVNLTNVNLNQCLQQGFEINVQAGSISNVNVSNLYITANNTYACGGGLLELASDTATPVGFSCIQFTNTSIVGSTKAANDGAACVLFRDSSNVSRTATIYSDIRFVNTEILGNNSNPWSQGFAGGWTNGITLSDTRIKSNAPTAIVLAKTRDWLAYSFRADGKTDVSSNSNVRMEFKDSVFGSLVANSTDGAPIVINGQPLTAAVITVSGGGSDDNPGSVASPILSNAEANRRLAKLVNQVVVNVAPVSVTSASYTMLITDSDLAVNVAGTTTITLLNPAFAVGRELRIKTITNNTVISASSNVENLVGSGVGTAILAATAGKWALLKSDGVNWRIMAGN